GLTDRDGSFLVGRKEGQTWEDLKGSTVLPGRRGGMPFMVLEYNLTNKGIIDYVYFNNSIQFSAMVSAFLGGTGDFVTVFEPVASMLELEGRGYVIEAVGEYIGSLPYTAYYALSSFIEENPELIRRFTRAISRGQKWVYENSSEDIANLISPFFQDTDLELLKRAIERYKNIGAFAQTPLIKPESFYRMQRIIYNAGELPKWVDFDTLITNEFIEH
ncbi:MAG: ABC transporter substrate-binding protein, partial [Defluviitaleaceae bacterium]|nr:ABC transporter substrate-binding protein [Defluviitaleaceae bacterium]